MIAYPYCPYCGAKQPKQNIDPEHVFILILGTHDMSIMEIAHFAGTSKSRVSRILIQYGLRRNKPNKNKSTENS